MNAATIQRAGGASIADLVDAEARGLLLRNPDNGRIFRAVYASWEGALPGVRVFPLGCRQAERSPIMSDVEIDGWLGTLELVRDARGVYRIDHGKTPFDVTIDAVSGSRFTIVSGRIAGFGLGAAGIAVVEPAVRLVRCVETGVCVRRRGIASALLAAAVDSIGRLSYARSARSEVTALCEQVGVAAI